MVFSGCYTQCGLVDFRQHVPLLCAQSCAGVSSGGFLFMADQSAPFTSLKLHLSYTEQLALLKERGMVVADEAAAIKTLQRLNYYRLSGYWYPFRKTNPVGTPGRQDGFQDGTTFELIAQLYEFDRRLRLLVIEAIERIEVAVRVDVSHQLGRKHRLAYAFPQLLDGKFVQLVNQRTGKTSYQEWLEKHEKKVTESKDDFVKHHHRKYGSRLPIWAAAEIWEFGQLSKLFAGMKYADQTYIAKRYGLPQGNHLASWLRTLNLVRNVAAHHGRLWNRNITERPSFPTTQPHHKLHHVAQSTPAQTRVYGALCVIQQMLSVIAPHDCWAEKLKVACQAFPLTPAVNLLDAGFTLDWEQKNLWQPA